MLGSSCISSSRTIRYAAKNGFIPGARKVGRDWLIHQTADKGKSIGGNSYYMDYNRWQGTHEDVLRYFGYAEGMEEPKEPEEPETPEPPVEQHDLAWLIEMHEDPSKHPPVG